MCACGRSAARAGCPDVAAAADIRRILVMKFRSPGDVLLMVPALKALRRGFPGARIAAAVNAEAAGLLELHPAVDEVMPYERRERRTSLAARARLEWELFRRVRGGRFELAVNATEGDRGALLALASGAMVRLGLAQEGGALKRLKNRLYHHLLPPWPRERHNVMANLDLMALLGLDVSDRRVEVALHGKEVAAVEQRLNAAGIEPGEPIVHVHAPSRVSYKCWTPEGMAAVIDHLERERRLKVVLSGAPEDKPYVWRIVDLCESRPLSVAGRLTLRETAALAGRACLFFGVDTVVMHLAAAQDTPVVALFGPTYASAWGPWDNAGPEAQYPEPRGVQRSGPHTLIQSGRRCVPCGNMGCGRSGRSACLEELSASEVIAVLDAALDRALAAPQVTSS